MMKILILNGPNLNLLGKREPGIYGNQSMEEYLGTLRQRVDGYEIEYYQSNHEGDIIDKLHQVGFDSNYVGIVLNAGAYTHTSLAIADAISAIKVPVIEVHISNVHAREQVRHHSMISAVCRGVIAGFGMNSYNLAINAFINN
ncbi:MAG: type II 3-dehydroquinate dehydratase [Muribaculaceae bacterium]|nr:type II 3-dehydroquinate dehydratase [Muribaculaceae bacterium]